MLSDVAVAACFGLGLLAFYGTSLYNLVKSRKAKKGVRYEAEVEMPRGLVFAFDWKGRKTPNDAEEKTGFG